MAQIPTRIRRGSTLTARSRNKEMETGLAGLKPAAYTDYLPVVMGLTGVLAASGAK